MIKKIINIILFIIVACTVFAGYGGYIKPSSTLLGKFAPLVVMAFPYIALVMIVMTVLACFITKRGWIIGLVGILVCTKPLLAVCPLNIGSVKPPANAKTITLLSFNVKGFMGEGTRMKLHSDTGNPVLQFIIARNADIVCLQEADVPFTPGRFGMSEEECAQIKSMYPYIIYRAEDALEILSKYPATYFAIPKVSQYRRGPYMGATLKIDGKEITLVNCHLESIGLDRSDKDVYINLTEGEGGRAGLKKFRHSAISKLSMAFRMRAMQADTIVSRIKDLYTPEVVVGDFNDVPLSYPIQALEQIGFKPVYPQVAFGPAITFHSDRLYFRIDHILTRGDIKPLNMTIFKNDISDHYAIESELAILK